MKNENNNYKTIINDNNHSTEDITKLKEQFRNLENDEIKASKKLKIFSTLFLILNFTIYINLFRPIMLIMNLIFSASLTVDLTRDESTSNTNKNLMLIGVLIINILPLLPFIRYICNVLSLTNKLGNKIYYFLILLFECYFDLPLTFLYNSNRHSLFLLEQDGVEQILNPWLIFFPTNYLTSFISLFKNTVISGYFIFMSVFIKIFNINTNVVEFSNIFKTCVLASNIINLLGVVLILIFIFVIKKKKKVK